MKVTVIIIQLQCCHESDSNINNDDYDDKTHNSKQGVISNIVSAHANNYDGNNDIGDESEISKMP